MDFHDIMDQLVGPNFIKLLLLDESVILLEFIFAFFVHEKYFQQFSIVTFVVHEKYFQQVSLVVIVFQLVF